MPSWDKQTHLLRNTDSLDERIDVLREWADGLKQSKLEYFLQSSFRTLNNPNRYKFYLDESTVTHEKYLTFLVCLEILCHNRHDDDWKSFAMDLLDMKSSKSYITLYFIMKLYLMKDELCRIRLHVSDDEVSDLIEYSKKGGYEFRDTDFYDYMTEVRALLKDYRKNRHSTGKTHDKKSYSDLLRENEELKSELKRSKKKSADNIGSVIQDMYDRRSMEVEHVPVKVKSKKKSRKVKVLKGAW